MKKEKDLLAHDALLREIADDVKNDELKSLWNKYGLLIILVVALALTAAVSFETFKNWVNRRNQEISNAYAVAISLQNQGRLDESLNILQNITERTSGIYQDIAKLQIANIYFEQNKPQEAATLLEELSEDAGNRQMQEIAALKLASYKLDSKAPAAEIKALLDPLADNDEANYNVARELLAMLAIRDGNIDEAKQQYEKIIGSPNISEGLKARAQDMLSLLNEKNY